ncbi:arsenate reductase (azurin) large subunit [Aquabacterium sp. A7-Y]|uniref:arsenate reductase (azurin) large subunit n=1 Tax=Aquabacterium sp. A7-Y TaxID=1349605 RepID=UPI00223E63D9|nr:arsenate reductase (azurin) large subunit [Aquabacterium sp. A7-Y]MCW7540989.1 arsenate reductase (azurin) large subunit [Aquabacterium sp. A7-Y]
MTGLDRIPLAPVDAQQTPMTCHFCIVGCGYTVYKWSSDSEGGRKPEDNALGIDFRKQAPPMATTLTPAMSNTIVERDGRRSHVLILPDRNCDVNGGLSSTRGGKLATYLYRSDGVTRERLLYPELYQGSHWRATTWQVALDVYARVLKHVLDEDGPAAVFFSAFDHGGAGGGFENTWGTGKLMFSAIQTPAVRIHNRPAYNSECHATREMGISELNNSYEDAQLADVVWSIGNNPYETQTNYFLNHWLPNLRGLTVDKKQQWFADEAVGPGKFVFVDPRRTSTIAISQHVAPNRVLHLDIQPGTDIALFNGLLTYVVEQGWIDHRFIAEHTRGFAEAVLANQLPLEECARITGISVDKLKQAAAWSYAPKRSGHRPRTMHAYEKGVIWGNDNYLIQSALVDLVLATHNVVRRGTGVVRMGGHQEGYARPPHPTGEKIHVDQELVAGRGRMMTWWACNNFQTTNNARHLRKVVLERSQIVKTRLSTMGSAPASELADAIYEATRRGGLFVTNINLYPTQLKDAAHLMLPAAQPGEMNLTSMNGERRLRLSQKFMDPPGEARPDCLIAAGIANRTRELYVQDGNSAMERRFSGFEWRNEEDAFNDGFRRAGRPGAPLIDSQGGATGHLATYERLRAAGNNGVQLPIREVKNGRLIGTPTLYADYQFDTLDGRAVFKPSPWPGLPSVVEKQRAKHRFWINNGRANEVWQTAYHDQYNAFVKDRYPLAYLEINPLDARELSVAAGDIVEVFNDYGATCAMAYPVADMKRSHTFMLFGQAQGTAGDVTSDWTDRNLIPYYKGAWASIRRVGSISEYQSLTSFKPRNFGAA